MKDYIDNSNDYQDYQDIFLKKDNFFFLSRFRIAIKLSVYIDHIIFVNNKYHKYCLIRKRNAETPFFFCLIYDLLQSSLIIEKPEMKQRIFFKKK
jgi:hypothetical protein